LTSGARVRRRRLGKRAGPVGVLRTVQVARNLQEASEPADGSDCGEQEVSVTVGRPSFRRLSLCSSVWYGSVVVGWTMLAVAIFSVATSSLTSAGPQLAMTAVLLLVLELRPLIQGRGHDPQGVVMSTAFVCATLFMWGIWPAVVVVSIAALASDLRAQKPVWKVLFNVGQYNVSLGTGYLVMMLAGHTPSLEAPLGSFSGADLLWVAAVWVTYFLVNLALVAAALAWTDSFRGIFLADFWHYTGMTFSVLALSPLIVVVAQNTWLLLPLLLIPLLLVHKMAQMSLENEHQAIHDSLTGLPNRAHLRLSLETELARSRRDGRPFGLLVIDLNHFKEINDTLGHHVGDQLLIQFAERLAHSVRTYDHVARLGGDEFAVIVPNADEPEARAVADRIRSSLAEPIALEGMLIDVEAAIGIALHPDHGRHSDDLLRLADVAMYVAKETREGVVTYSAQRDRNSAERLSLLGELRQALDDGVLELHYQPKISMADSSLLGVEALIRWNHPVRGYVPPDEFIPLAERSGIMPALTERVLTLALQQMARWRDQGIDVMVAVNVSLSDLVGGRLAGVVSAGLREYGVPAPMLQLEITERVVAQESAELDEVLLELIGMGVTLSLDDFGTDYSSLLRLQTLPVDELKIDRAFVSRLPGDSAALGIVRAVIDLAHALGMPAVAEGVETEDEWRVLRSLGCDGAQGWYIGGPMSAEDTTDWIVLHAAGAPLKTG
jgi:diguanylate cyclase (GGDEF)-like protein